MGRPGPPFDNRFFSLPKSTYWSASRSVQPLFAGLTTMTDLQTDRQTDRPRYYVCICNRPHLRSARTHMRPNTNNNCLLSVKHSNHKSARVKAKFHYAIQLASWLASWSQTSREPVCDQVRAISTCRDSSKRQARELDSVTEFGPNQTTSWHAGQRWTTSMT